MLKRVRRRKPGKGFLVKVTVCYRGDEGYEGGKEYVILVLYKSMTRWCGSVRGVSVCRRGVVQKPCTDGAKEARSQSVSGRRPMIIHGRRRHRTRLRTRQKHNMRLAVRHPLYIHLALLLPPRLRESPLLPRVRRVVRRRVPYRG